MPRHPLPMPHRDIPEGNGQALAAPNEPSGDRHSGDSAAWPPFTDVRESVTCESYAATVGLRIPFVVWTRVQSMPSNSAANSTGESFTTPSIIGGQRNDP